MPSTDAHDLSDPPNGDAFIPPRFSARANVTGVAVGIAVTYGVLTGTLENNNFWRLETTWVQQIRRARKFIDSNANASDGRFLLLMVQQMHPRSPGKQQQGRSHGGEIDGTGDDHAQSECGMRRWLKWSELEAKAEPKPQRSQFDGART